MSRNTFIDPLELYSYCSDTMKKVGTMKSDNEEGRYYIATECKIQSENEISKRYSKKRHSNEIKFKSNFEIYIIAYSTLTVGEIYSTFL